MAPRIPPASEEKGESRGGRKIYCYYYRQEGHYSQYPVKSKEKQPTINTMIAEVIDVQQVTTWSKGKASELGDARRSANKLMDVNTAG